jgi:long-chain fatty acid transport protein
MKKQIVLLTTLLTVANIAFGGGIVTNTNQSAAWVRTLVRDASTDADAVYFNPAGLVRLNDGFHFSLNSQTIFQEKDVTSNYRYFNTTPKKFKGDVKAPVFPSLYATWKKNKFAVSFGFNPIGGGGGATYKSGLPSFEMPVADLPVALAGLGATNYRLDAYLKGTSVFFGYQGGVTYKINDMISVYGGIRYVTAKNTYEGHLKNIDLLMGGNWVPASDVLNGVAATITASAAQIQDAIAGGIIGADDPVSPTLAANLAALGIDATGFTNGIAVAAMTQASAGYQANAGLLGGQEVDVTQKGTGIAPILGVNLNLNEKLNIGIKYEFRTRIQVKNETTKDFILGYSGTTPITMFPNGEKINNDLPAMLSLGVNYKVIPKLNILAGVHYYFDKSANYGKTLDGEYVANSKVIDKNYYELALGLEYDLTEKLLVSGGYLLAKSGVSQSYQTDMSFDLTSSTVGLGFCYKLTGNLKVNVGGAYTKYVDGVKDYNVVSLVGTTVPVKDTYFMKNVFFGLGVDFSF